MLGAGPQQAGRSHLGGLPVPLARTFGGAASLEDVAKNVLSAQQRSLPRFDRLCERNEHRLSIIAGGPSAKDTLGKISGRIMCVNGAHDMLIENGIWPHACTLLCPVDYLTDAFAFTPRTRVQYFVASLCHPKTFDRLDGHRVVLWHASQPEGRSIDPLLPKGTLQIGGGGFVSLRCINLGYALGFRDFHLHGFDSSGRKLEDGEVEHHAYAQGRDDERFKEPEVILGYPTYLALYAQISDFFRTLDRFEKPDMDPCTFTVHGDGLFQESFRRHFGGDAYTTQSKENAHA